MDTDRAAADASTSGRPADVEPIVGLANCKLISQGAEARVWETTYCGRPCIIKQRFSKQYRHPALDRKLTSTRLKQEARSVLRARKAGVPTPVLYCVEAESASIYMERIDGRSIRHLLHDGLLDAAARSRVMADVGRLLALLHDGGLIHGDLTTSNMLVREADGGVVLIDFGLSYNSTLPEDKGVDLYVLERALTSAHSELEGLFDEILASYRQHSKQWSATFNRFAEEWCISAFSRGLIAVMPRARQPVVYDFELELGTPFTPSALPSVVGALIKHLQYSRGQCTAPVDRLVAGYNAAVTAHEQGKRKRVPTSVRRLGKYLAQLRDQLDALRTLPLEPLLTRRAALALLLGATPLRPREVYLIRFDAGLGHGAGGAGGGVFSCGVSSAPGSAACDGFAAALGARQPAGAGGSGGRGQQTVALPKDGPEETRALDTAGKRLLRGVIVQGSAIEEWADVCAPTKMFLMVQAPAARPPGGCFLPRRSFCLSLRKAFQVSLQVRFDPPLGGARPCGHGHAPPHHAGTGGSICGTVPHAPASAERRGRKRRQAASQHTAQTLEEQLEASMQLCTSSESEGEGRRDGDEDGTRGRSMASGAFAGDAAAAETGGEVADNPDALVWYQCHVAVKGMRQEKQPG